MKPKIITSDLESIPGVGRSIAQDLRELGIQKTSHLVGQDPQDLYDRHCRQRGMHVDRCVLYTFRCAVYAASTKNPDPEKMKWWKWKDAD